MPWVPDNVWSALKAGKGQGTGNGQSKGWGKGKGKGKGKNRWCTQRCFKEKKVWIGGLPENATSKERNKALKELMGAVFAEIGKSGTGVATFNTQEEAAAAVDSFNGAKFQGSILQVYAWTKQ